VTGWDESGAAICTPAGGYQPEGPQTNVPATDLVGWTQCYSGTYNQNNVSIASILGTCSKANLLLACRPVGNPSFTVLAPALRSDVLTDTGFSNTPHDANKAGWYFSPSYSWGFAKQGDPITRSSCDTAGVNPDRRLCWHTGGGNLNGGWRCGATTGLNGSSAWERVIYHRD
jgi:hypothetical protein